MSLPSTCGLPHFSGNAHLAGEIQWTDNYIPEPGTPDQFVLDYAREKYKELAESYSALDGLSQGVQDRVELWVAIGVPQGQRRASRGLRLEGQPPHMGRRVFYRRRFLPYFDSGGFGSIGFGGVNFSPKSTGGFVP